MNTTLKLEQVHKKTNLHTELNLCIMNGESEDVVKDEVTIIGGFQEEQLAKSMWWVIICLGTQQNNMLNWEHKTVMVDLYLTTVFSSHLKYRVVSVISMLDVNVIPYLGCHSHAR